MLFNIASDGGLRVMGRGPGATFDIGLAMDCAWLALREEPDWPELQRRITEARQLDRRDW